MRNWLQVNWTEGGELHSLVVVDAGERVETGAVLNRRVRREGCRQRQEEGVGVLGVGREGENGETSAIGVAEDKFGMMLAEGKGAVDAGETQAQARRIARKQLGAAEARAGL